MEEEKTEPSLLTNLLQTTMIKSATKEHNVSNQKLTFLDSTAVTNKLIPDTTMDSNGVREGVSDMKNENSSLIFGGKKSRPDLYNSQIPLNTSEVLLEKKYEQINAQFVSDNKEPEIELLENGQLQVNPKKIEAWLSTALRGAVKKGLFSNDVFSGMKTVTSKDSFLIFRQRHYEDIWNKQRNFQS